MNGDVTQPAPDRRARPRDDVVDVEPVFAVLLLPFHILRAQTRRLPQTVALRAAAQCGFLRVRHRVNFINFL